MNAQQTLTSKEISKDLLALAYHEAGHAAIAYWLGFELQSHDLHCSAKGGGFKFPSSCPGEYVKQRLQVSPDCRSSVVSDAEDEILRLLGGPVAENLRQGWIVTRAIRYSDEYRYPGSDSARIREILRALTGKNDDKPYQLRIQDKCRAIIQDGRTWAAIEEIGLELASSGFMAGEEAERIFEKHGAPRLYS